MRVLFVVILATCIPLRILDAQSRIQPPTINQQNSAQQERGSEQLPLMVKILPEQKSQGEIARENAKDEADRNLVNLTGRLANYTEFLFFATAALVGVTGGLVWVGYRQISDARDSIAAAVKSANAAEKAANAAEAQTAIIGSQSDTIMKQHAVGRLQFLAAHRPRLRVRHVSIVTAERFGHPTIFFSHGEEIKGGLIVVNIGGTKATIVESRYRIYFSREGLPITAPYDETFHNLLLPEQVLDVGESCATPIADQIFMNPNRTTLRQFERDGWTLYVMGQIRYQDEGGCDRFMGFCREWADDGRFHPVKDPDYEYED
jgi:hypothetical protein